MVEKFASGRKTFEVILLNLIGCLFANLQCESLFFNGLNDLVLSTFILFCSTRCVLNIPLSCVLTTPVDLYWLLLFTRRELVIINSEKSRFLEHFFCLVHLFHRPKLPLNAQFHVKSNGEVRIKK